MRLVRSSSSDSSSSGAHPQKRMCQLSRLNMVGLEIAITSWIVTSGAMRSSSIDVARRSAALGRRADACSVADAAHQLDLRMEHSAGA